MIKEGRYIRQCSSRGRFAVVELQLESIQEDKVEIEFWVKGNMRYQNAIERAIAEITEGKGIRKYPVIGIKVSVTGLAEHPTDSSEMDFWIAAIMDWKEAEKETEWEIYRKE